MSDDEGWTSVYDGLPKLGSRVETKGQCPKKVRILVAERDGYVWRDPETHQLPRGTVTQWRTPNSEVT